VLGILAAMCRLVPVGGCSRWWPACTTWPRQGRGPLVGLSCASGAGEYLRSSSPQQPSLRAGSVSSSLLGSHRLVDHKLPAHSIDIAARPGSAARMVDFGAHSYFCSRSLATAVAPRSERQAATVSGSVIPTRLLPLSRYGFSRPFLKLPVRALGPRTEKLRGELSWKTSTICGPAFAAWPRRSFRASCRAYSSNSSSPCSALTEEGPGGTTRGVHRDPAQLGAISH
jgi:hypothetical protein